MEKRLINLARSSDRLALFKARNPHLPDIQRVPAIDGRAADREWLRVNGIMSPDLSYSDGAVGCALSHLNQWRDAVRRDVPLTIIEDDAVLSANFREESARLIATLPPDWEYVMWGYNFDAPLTYDLGEEFSPCTSLFDQPVVRGKVAGFGRVEVASRLFKLLRGFGTVCYSVSPRGAMRLIEFCLPLRPMETRHPALPHPMPNTGIDNMLAHLWPSMLAYVAVPPLVLNENDHDLSTVQGSARGRVAAADTFPGDAFLTIFEEVGATDETAIGLRTSHDAVLATSDLRRAGWGGFDIAVRPAMLLKALQDRAVPAGFDLLHLGTGQGHAEILSCLLPSFRPRVVVLPVEHSVGAAELQASRGERTDATDGILRHPVYRKMARAFGYSLHACPEAPRHALMLRGDVTCRSGEPWADLADERHDRVLPGDGWPSPAAREEVRLWQ
ncbi:glycosyltransferase family 25 protein [Muricoccus aerilatus]|uniref:glycosyltransferase family 25 protein n=1 Tax=Muricoccus aerilatus TaxID=452982 RepID=UPI0005C23FD4|nr:glycosyltransferase family 25 protein [Roseomonas aerilata]